MDGMADEWVLPTGELNSSASNNESVFANAIVLSRETPENAITELRNFAQLESGSRRAHGELFFTFLFLFALELFCNLLIEKRKEKQVFEKTTTEQTTNRQKL